MRERNGRLENQPAARRARRLRRDRLRGRHGRPGARLRQRPRPAAPARVGQADPGFETGLVGARAGEQRVLELTFPDNYGNAGSAGRGRGVHSRRQGRAGKILPDLDDEFASEAGGYETLDELREEIAKELLEADERRREREYREAVVAAASANTEFEVPDALGRGPPLDADAAVARRSGDHQGGVSPSWPRSRRSRSARRPGPRRWRRCAERRRSSR